MLGGNPFEPIVEDNSETGKAFQAGYRWGAIFWRHRWTHHRVPHLLPRDRHLNKTAPFVKGAVLFSRGDDVCTRDRASSATNIQHSLLDVSGFTKQPELIDYLVGGPNALGKYVQTPRRGEVRNSQALSKRLPLGPTSSDHDRNLRCMVALPHFSCLSGTAP